MKNPFTKIGVFTIVILAYSSAYAQMNFGVRAGMNYSIVTSKFKIEPAEKPDNPIGIGYHFGGYMTYMFTDNLGFRPELVISIRNLKESDTYTQTFNNFDSSNNPCIETDNVEEKYKYGFSYLEIPLLLDFHPLEGLNLQVGPQLAFRVGYKEEHTYSESTTCNSETTQFTSVTKTHETTGLNGLDFGMDIGGTYELNSGLNFGLRYEFGLNALNSNTSYVSSKWNVIQLSAGYTFGKGK